MKIFFKALKTMVYELVFACFVLPFMIVGLIAFELLDPIVRFYDTLKTNK